MWDQDRYLFDILKDITRSKDIDMINRSDADWLHLDVMDGVFVPNISFGFPVLEAVAKLCQKPLDVHLMIEDPGRYVQDFRDAGADILTIAGENFSFRYSANSGQSFAPKAKGVDSIKIHFGSNLACGVAQKGSLCIVARHAVAVVANAHINSAALFYFNSN